jgi:hypothetical protein
VSLIHYNGPAFLEISLTDLFYLNTLICLVSSQANLAMKDHSAEEMQTDAAAPHSPNDSDKEKPVAAHSQDVHGEIHKETAQAAAERGHAATDQCANPTFPHIQHSSY